MHRTHFTTMVADFPVFLRDVEVEPGMRIDQIHTREFALELDGLAKVVLSSAVMSKRDRRQYQHDGQCKSSIHDSSPGFRFDLLPGVYVSSHAGRQGFNA